MLERLCLSADLEMSQYLPGRARGGSCPCKQDPDKRGRMDSFGFVVVLKVILRLFHQFFYLIFGLIFYPFVILRYSHVIS